MTQSQEATLKEKIDKMDTHLFLRTRVRKGFLVETNSNVKGQTEISKVIEDREFQTNGSTRAGKDDRLEN